MTGVRMRVLVGISALLLVGAACGSDGDGTAAAGTSSATGGTGASGENEPGPGNLYGRTTGSMGSTGGTGAAAKADVSISLNNYLFDPAEVEVHEGDVVAVRNGNTRTPHTFTVVGEDVDLELAPLETETVEIDLKPGTYDLICRFHEQLGMTATLTVT
jgi:plastocyanin